MTHRMVIILALFVCSPVAGQIRGKLAGSLDAEQSLDRLRALQAIEEPAHVTRERLTEHLADEQSQAVHVAAINAEIVKYSDVLKAKRRARVDGRVNTVSNGGKTWTFAGKAAKEQSIAGDEQRLKDLRAILDTPIIIMPQLDLAAVQPSDVGELRFANVLQIIDDKNALIEDRRQTVWLSGMSTRDWVDGRRVSLEGLCFEVSGNKQYRTAAGTTKTVAVLQPFDPKPHIDAATKLISDRNATKKRR